MMCGRWKPKHKVSVPRQQQLWTESIRPGLKPVRGRASFIAGGRGLMTPILTSLCTPRRSSAAASRCVGTPAGGRRGGSTPPLAGCPSVCRTGRARCTARPVSYATGSRRSIKLLLLSVNKSQVENDLFQERTQNFLHSVITHFCCVFFNVLTSWTCLKKSTCTVNRLISMFNKWVFILTSRGRCRFSPVCQIGLRSA